MAKLEVLKDKWFLRLKDDSNPLNKRHSGTGLNDWTDGNKVEMLVDGNAVMEHFYGCVEKMIRFMEENENTPNPPQIWLANFNLTNVEMLGPKRGGRIHSLMLNAAQRGIKVYFLHSSHLAQRLNYVWKPWKARLKKFIKMLNKEKRGFATSDSRNPLIGIHHQKFYVCLWPEPKDWTAVVSSADFNNESWDTTDHMGVKNPTHEFSFAVRGPAVRDIALTFAERWNNRKNLNRTCPKITNLIPIDFLNTPIPKPIGGSQSVQVLRTYPIHISRRNNSALPPLSLSYSWSHQGEFTVWGAYLKAIKKAKHHIYIEDQYLGSIVSLSSQGSLDGFLYDADLVYQLGKALERNVDIVILLPDEHEEKWGFKRVLKHQKHMSIKYLQNIYNRAHSNSKKVGRLVIRFLSVKNKSVIVHSKLMIVDDEFVLVGTANFGNRSMTFDSEIHLGIVDKKGLFPREMRLALWQEHLQLTEEESDRNNPYSIINKIKDPKEGITVFTRHNGPATRRLRSHRIMPLKNYIYRSWLKFLGDWITQPYAGPQLDKLE